MSEVSASPPTSRKRSHDGTVISPQPSKNENQSGENSLPTPSSRTPSANVAFDRDRQASPTLSTTSSTLTDLTDVTGEACKSTNTGPAAPGKKRKLTFTEKEAKKVLKRQEQEAKEKQKAEDLARKEEEKRNKDEGKRKREEEKEIVRREKELQKAEKQKVKDAREEEKRKKEEERQKEKQKKERSQMRLGAFFGKPSMPSTPPSRTSDHVSSGVSSRRSSIASIGDVEMQDAKTPASSKKSANLDYEQLFPPFFVHANTDVAPANRFTNRKCRSNFMASDAIFQASPTNVPQVQDSFRCRKFRKDRSWRMPNSVRTIVDLIQGSSNTPIDLTEEREPLRIETLLAGVPLKVFSFHEDVRPGYQGTCTRHVTPRTASKLCRHPFGRDLPDTNYDYDSEAEWEPPEEGDDDVDAVDEESGSEEDEEEMGEFLDDEDDSGRRRLIVGNMEPQCSGLCWQGTVKKEKLAVQQEGGFNMQDFRMEIISEEHCFPIDPFSTKYWTKASIPIPTPARTQLSPNSAALMQPPRLPLHASNQTNVPLGLGQATPYIKQEFSIGAENSSSHSNPSMTQPATRGSQKPLRLIASDLLPAFRQAVSGSDLNKVGLVEILKKQFPTVAKDVIRDTLSTVAVRQGVKEADKRWVLTNPP